MRASVSTWITVLVTLGLPICGIAQETAVVQGRIVESGSSVGIENAGVVLEGHGSSLSRAGGLFRIEAVPVGPQVLTVRALGYATLSLELLVRGDTTVTVSLDVQPLALDSLTVELTSIEIRGRVRDPELDIPLAGAEVLTDQADPEWTNFGGRFDLDVWEGIPLTLSVRAFGYHPLDTAVVPVEDAEYRLHPIPDPLVGRMIEVEIARLQKRSAGRRSVLMPPLSRDDLLRWSNASLSQVLKSNYSIHLRRVRCVLVDEEQLSSTMIGPTLRTIFASEVERVEFLFRGAMLRVYTRDFIRRMLGGGIPLRIPSYAYFPPSEPLCR